MSQWTHVNASIRFDVMLGHGMPTKEELGKMCLWGDEDTSHWDNPDLPCGSEESIQYKIVNTGPENSLANTAVIFTGDLRDYNDTKEILNYFKKITKDKMIRSGILEIYVEYRTSLIYRYIEDNWILVYELTEK